MGPERQLFKNAAALSRPAMAILKSDLAQGLDVKRLGLKRFNLRKDQVLPFNGQTTLGHAMTPLGVTIAEARHVELVDRRVRRAALGLVAIVEENDGAGGVAGSGAPLHPSPREVEILMAP